jgi:sigma-E factor negative regulatory protein RseC
MLYQAGLVAETKQSRARIEFKPGNACHGCSAGRGCGLGPLVALFRHRGYQLWIDLNGVQAESVNVGDAVRIGLPAGELIKISIVAYLLPVVGMLAGGSIAAALLPQFGDVSALLGAGFGVVAGWAGLGALRSPGPFLLIN